MRVRQSVSRAVIISCGWFRLPRSTDSKRHLKHAIAEKGGDNIIDITWSLERQFWILGTVNIIRAEGKVIRYLENKKNLLQIKPRFLRIISLKATTIEVDTCSLPENAHSCCILMLFLPVIYFCETLRVPTRIAVTDDCDNAPPGMVCVPGGKARIGRPASADGEIKKGPRWVNEAWDNETSSDPPG